MKQFLRFDAGKFNIWYAGALMVAGLTSVVLLSELPAENPLPENPEVPVLETSPEAAKKEASPELKEEKKRRAFSGRSAERSPKAREEKVIRSQEINAEEQEESAGIAPGEDAGIQNNEQIESVKQSPESGGPVYPFRNHGL